MREHTTPTLIRWALFDETPPPSLPDGVDRVGDLSDEELADLESSLLGLFDDARQSDHPDVAHLEAIADAVDSVRAEAAVRIEAREAADRAVAELEARVRPPADENSSEEPPADEPAETDAHVDAEAVAAAAQAPPRAPVSALALVRPAGNAPRPRPASTVDMADISRQLVDRARRWTSGPNGGQVVVRIPADYPAERILDRQSSPVVTRRQIDQVVSPQAIVAAGGLCAPVAGYYERIGLATDDRPVRDGLPSFQATRGGIRYNEAWEVADFSGATDVWTEATDTTPGMDTKDRLTVACPAEVEVLVAATTRRVKIGNFLDRFNTELTDDIAVHVIAAHARRADAQLLDRLKALSTAVTTGQALGAARDLLYAAGVAAAGLRSRLRIPDGVQMRVMMPRWARDMMAGDILRSLNAYAEQLAVGYAEIDGYFAARGVAPIWYLDTPTTGTSQQFADQDPGGLWDFPEDVQWAIYPEGTFVHLDGGSLDLGVVRDSTLNATNDLETFGETFENVALVGPKALWVTSTVCANGTSSAGEDISTAVCGGPYAPGS